MTPTPGKPRQPSESSSQTLVAIRQLPYCTREENESKYESQEYDDETEIGSKTANEIHKAEDAHEKREEACHVFVGPKNDEDKRISKDKLEHGRKDQKQSPKKLLRATEYRLV
ncbi:hypothetical protein PENNAL_c0104G11786 [Penicillium nalgiovense]|uniref:Uncharacterized protein n=1 Tax=Penicillium nalgiovense TaxID=60175 RepID=A0A1V6X8U2_PENNA|nr:hypothetical protein PENNAL_c0104G11786 [Penicillium nalgiovense]